MTKDQLLTEAKALAPDEREALADEIWMTLHDHPTAIEAAWIEECQRRIDAVDRGEMKTIPGEQTMVEIFRQLK